MSDTEREALEAGTVWWDGELFTGRPNWHKLLVGEGAAAHGRGAGVHRRTVRGAVPHGRRLGRHAPARRPAARGLGLPQEEGLLRDDHPEEVRRARVLGVRAFVRAGEAREPQRDPRLDRGRAELAGPGRAAAALRHRGAEGPLPAASRARRGRAVLRADRAPRRLRRGVDSRHGRRLPRPVRGSGGRRPAAQFLQALHHARTGRDRGRARVPAVRP